MVLTELVVAWLRGELDDVERFSADRLLAEGVDAGDVGTSLVDAFQLLHQLPVVVVLVLEGQSRTHQQTSLREAVPVLLYYEGICARWSRYEDRFHCSVLRDSVEWV